MKMHAANLNLGDKVKDKVVGVEGIVVGKTQWLNGRTSVLVQCERQDDDPADHDSVVELDGPFEKIGTVDGGTMAASDRAVLPAMATRGGRYDAAGQALPGDDGSPAGMRGTRKRGDMSFIPAPPSDPLTGASSGQTQDQTLQSAKAAADAGAPAGTDVSHPEAVADATAKAQAAAAAPPGGQASTSTSSGSSTLAPSTSPATPSTTATPSQDSTKS
jgi:hypothetical protein